ncbi:MAG: RDD family protein, partial [Bdellovibrionia bacterium]
MPTYSASHASRLKASVVNRVIAKVIDILIVFALAVSLPYRIGPLLGFLYSLLADGFNRGVFHSQSVGKKLMKLQVISTITKKPANWKESVLRNTPVGVATFFSLIPIWGWLILALIGIPLMLMEIYLMLRVDTGHRLGDVMGDTEVV